MDTYAKLRRALTETMESQDWGREEVRVKVRTLTPQEAIGDPEHQDYPLIKGRERMMAAGFRGFQGQAFTDQFGDFQGSLEEVAGMDLANNFRRAVFLATLNAVLRARGRAEKTIHCKDEAPPQCAAALAEMVGGRFGNPKVALVGLQPRMAQALGARFPLRITDMDRDNIGAEKFGGYRGGPGKDPGDPGVVRSGPGHRHHLLQRQRHGDAGRQAHYLLRGYCGRCGRGSGPGEVLSPGQLRGRGYGCQGCDPDTTRF